MSDPALDARADDGRNETVLQRMDRNWGELVQELRVLQTGVQLLTGFLLTLPFQARFAELDRVQHGMFLAVVLLSVTSTVLLVAPVAFHRVLFRRGQKRELVDIGARFVQSGLVALAGTICGVVLLVVDVVAGRVPAVVAAGVLAVLVFTAWWGLPLRARARRD